MTLLSFKNGFTLSEVLITLGIIGVAAAMTLPALINKYNEQTWLTQFKDTYSILSQAYLRAYYEHGTIKNWSLDADDTKESASIIAEYLKPHLKLAADFKQNQTHNSHSLPIHYLGLNGNKELTNFNGWDNSHYIFALANGATIGLYTYFIDNVDQKARAAFYVDINGAKGPNQFGKDFFVLCLNTKNNYPVITGYDLWWLTQDNCSRTKSGTSWYSGGGCAIWVIATGNMAYLHREISKEEWNQIKKDKNVPET